MITQNSCSSFAGLEPLPSHQSLAERDALILWLACWIVALETPRSLDDDDRSLLVIN